jgi:predicted nucleotidyltransferase component of viral defense system
MLTKAQIQRMAQRNGIGMQAHEKMRALLVRNKPRDLYDLWLLRGQGVQPDRALIERKLALYGMAWEPAILQEALQRARADWERDLRPLLPQFVPYETVRAGIETLLAFDE